MHSSHVVIMPCASASSSPKKHTEICTCIFNMCTRCCFVNRCHVCILYSLQYSTVLRICLRHSNWIWDALGMATLMYGCVNRSWDLSDCSLCTKEVVSPSQSEWVLLHQHRLQWRPSSNQSSAAAEAPTLYTRTHVPSALHSRWIYPTFHHHQMSSCGEYPEKHMQSIDAPIA